MGKSNNTVKLREFVALVFILLLYLVLRLSNLQTIEFGFDQPLLAQKVIDFLRNPNFLESYDLVGVNPWGYPSWGPVQIFFYSIFLLISKNPIIFSTAIAVFNSLSIVFVYLTAKGMFSRRAGLIAALALTVHPWWVVFSRMLYQPTPVPTFVALAIYITYRFINGKTKVYYLIFLWGFLFQLYVHTLGFIIFSIVFLAKKLGKTRPLHLVAGIFTTTILYLPVLKYYLNNSNQALGFVTVYKKFGAWAVDGFDYLGVFKEYLAVLSGGSFFWQLGYGYSDFVAKHPHFKVIWSIGLLVCVSILAFAVGKVIKAKKSRLYWALLLAWAVAPIFFLSIIKSPDILPRFFLVALPAYAILIGAVSDGISQRFKKLYRIGSVATNLVLIVLFIGWINVTVSYYKFVSTYNYSKGFLSNYSDVPYSYTETVVDWISAKNGDNPNGFTIYSSHYLLERTEPNYALEYVIANLLKPQAPSKDGNNYLVLFRSNQDKIKLPVEIVVGPYVVYKLPDLISDPTELVYPEYAPEIDQNSQD